MSFQVRNRIPARVESGAFVAPSPSFVLCGADPKSFIEPLRGEWFTVSVASYVGVTDRIVAIAEIHRAHDGWRLFPLYMLGLDDKGQPAWLLDSVAHGFDAANEHAGWLLNRHNLIADQAIPTLRDIAAGRTEWHARCGCYNGHESASGRCKFGQGGGFRTFPDRHGYCDRCWTRCASEGAATASEGGAR